MSKDVTKKEKKAPSAYVVIFLITVVVAVLTWIIPGGVYELDEAGNAIAGTYAGAESNPQGIWDIGMAPINGMNGAIAISLSIMLFGSFLQMMDESGAIKIYLSNIAKKFQTNYHVLIWVLVGTFIVGMIHRLDMNKIIDIVMQGAASVVPTALVVPMARGIQVLMSDGGITSTILHFGESALSSLPPVVFVLVCMVFYFAFASLMPSSTGLAAATMSIMAPLAVYEQSDAKRIGGTIWERKTLENFCSYPA